MKEAYFNLGFDVLLEEKNKIIWMFKSVISINEGKNNNINTSMTENKHFLKRLSLAVNSVQILNKTEIKQNRENFFLFLI